MKRADVYRQMLRTELAPFRIQSDDDVLRVLRDSWERADGHPLGWTEAERDIRLLWSALGLLAFGHLDHVDAALQILRDRPLIVQNRSCRYYLSALGHLLPFPMSAVNEPSRALAWYMANRAKLQWSETSGSFEVRSE